MNKEAVKLVLDEEFDCNLFELEEKYITAEKAMRQGYELILFQNGEVVEDSKYIKMVQQRIKNRTKVLEG